MVSGFLPFRNFAAVGSLGLAFQAKVHGSIQFNNLAGSKKVPDGRRFTGLVALTDVTCSWNSEGVWKVW